LTSSSRKRTRGTNGPIAQKYASGVGFRRSNFRRSKQEIESFYDQEIIFFPYFS